jgi:hypothetical protein
MASRKLRFAIALLPLTLIFALFGLMGPGASAQGPITVSIVNQPTDAKVGELITAATFDPTGGGIDGPGYVEVLVTETVTPIEGEPYEAPVEGAEVSFDLAADESGTLATGDLNVDSRFTDEFGIARFEPLEGSENPLHIDDLNQPFTTDYELVPVAVPPTATTTAPPFIGAAFALEGINGDPSTPFDVWEDGCKGNGCSVNLTPGTSSDTYTTSEIVAMGASQLGLGGGTTIFCPTQQLIFSTNLFFHATTGNGPVFLISHISALDRKKVANNGNKVMGWCVGLKTPGPWNFRRQDTNGNGSIGAGDLYVGMAPKCPSKNASTKAPCIVSQTGDGVGGTYIRGWLPGGDPPRRT